MAIDGKPAINTPRNAERELITAIGNIRERIQKLEVTLNVLIGQAGQSSFLLGKSNATMANLQSQINQINSEINSLILSIGFGATIDFIAGENLAEGNAVFPLTDTTVGIVDPTNPLQIYAAIGIAETGASVGNTVTVRQFGIKEITGAAFTIGRAVYADIGGGLTQAPTYASVTIPIGVAASTTALFVRPNWPALYATAFDPVYEDFLPITKKYFDDNVPAPTTGSGTYPFLTDENDEDILTEAGYRIRIED